MLPQLRRTLHAIVNLGMGVSIYLNPTSAVTEWLKGAGLHPVLLTSWFLLASLAYAYSTKNKRPVNAFFIIPTMVYAQGALILAFTTGIPDEFGYLYALLLGLLTLDYIGEVAWERLLPLLLRY